MEARTLSALFFCASAALSLGAGYRTQNFVVSAATPQLATEIGQAAENFRSKLAVEWLGRELASWPEPCPIEAQVAPHLGAGGATSFVFVQGQPRQWTMTIQGSRERVIDSVLPHEITHTIFATHFGRPLPRWADEGACTTVEHSSEKMKQEQNLIVFLKSNRGIAFNQMFAMKEYPRDILPLYSQGFSLARFLIQQGGKRKYVEYVGEGMQRNDWHGVTRKHYGFQDLSDLQLSWVEWVKQGSPAISDSASPESVASNGRPETPVREAAAEVASKAKPARFASTNEANGGRVTEAYPSPRGPQPNDDPRFAPKANPAPPSNGGGFYSRAKEQPVENPAAGSAYTSTTRQMPREEAEPMAPQSLSRPPNPEPARQVILEWSRHPNDRPAATWAQQPANSETKLR